LDDELVPFYDIRLQDSGKEKQTTDSHLSSLTDDLFKAAAQGQQLSSGSQDQQGRARSGSVGSELPDSPERKLPGRSKSMGSSGVVPSLSPGPLRKGRRADRRQPSKMPRPAKALTSEEDDLIMAAAQAPGLGRAVSTGSETKLPDRSKSNTESGKGTAMPRTSRFTENQVVYYSSNGQKEKAKILSIHLDDELVPFYDIRLLDSGKEKQTTDSHISSLTDDLFKTAAQGQVGRGRSTVQDQGRARSGSVGPGLQHTSPERKLPDRSRSFDVPGAAISRSPGPLKKGRRTGRCQSSTMPSAAQASSSGTANIKTVRRQSCTMPGAAQASSSGMANIKKELGGYGGMSPGSYNYANEGEMREAWKIIQADSKLSVARLKKELRDLGQSADYIEKNEMIGALCKARLNQKAGRGVDKLGGTDREERPLSDGPVWRKVQRRNSDGPLSMLKAGKRRAVRGNREGITGCNA